MRDERKLREEISDVVIYGQAEIWGRKASTAHAIPL